MILPFPHPIMMLSPHTTFCRPKMAAHAISKVCTLLFQNKRAYIDLYMFQTTSNKVAWVLILPQEILEEIASSLMDDADLWAMALVCRPFRDPAQRCLFKYPTFSPDTMSTCETFINVLKGDNSHLMLGVRGIKIDFAGKKDGEHQPTIQAFHTILPVMMGLKRLHLCSYQWLPNLLCKDIVASQLPVNLTHFTYSVSHITTLLATSYSLIDRGACQTGHTRGFKPSILSDPAAWCQWLSAFIHLQHVTFACSQQLWSECNDIGRVEDALRIIVGKAGSDFQRILCWTSTEQPTWGRDHRMIGCLFHEQISHSYSLTKTTQDVWEFKGRSATMSPGVLFHSASIHVM